MSWLWGSSKPKTVEQSQASVAESKEVTPSHLESNLVSETSVPSQPLTRDQQVDQELIALLKEFQAESEREKEKRIEAKEAGGTDAVPIPSDISPDSLYQKELSCRSALDYALFCQSFGGQFVNVYRYGTFRSCSNHWSDFWMCMRVRGWEEKEKTKAIQDHYRQKAIKWKTGPSSEDIWQVRTEPVKDAFQANLEDLEARIADWKKANPGVPDPWDKRRGTTFQNPAPGST